MEFNTSLLPFNTLSTDCIVIWVFSDNSLEDNLLDKTSQQTLSTIITQGDLLSKAGSTLVLNQVANITAKRVVLVRLGDKKLFTATLLHTIIEQLVSTVLALPIVSATVSLPDLADTLFNAQWLTREITQSFINQSYRFDHFKTDPEPPSTLNVINFISNQQAKSSEIEQGIQIGQAIAQGMTLTKTLGNLPSNICTPSYLAKAAKTLGKEWGIKVKVLETDALEKLGMQAFLAVARGSSEPPKCIVLHYQGGVNKAQPIVLVGKGITFDSGGISLKPGENMDEMKYDMCGAGTVLGVLRAVAELKLAINIIGIIPTCENMPSGHATKPGDIVKSMAGLNIEILNTDAEGRLILCDALTYAKQFDPAYVIDIATLTGACVIALGHITSGLFSNDEALAQDLLLAGQTSGDKAWQLPLFAEYREALKSNFADMANIGGRPAGSITAACFLAHFTEGYRWAHLDIAGTAWKSGIHKGATGRPVPLLVEFLRQESLKIKASPSNA